MGTTTKTKTKTKKAEVKEPSYELIQFSILSTNVHKLEKSGYYFRTVAEIISPLFNNPSAIIAYLQHSISEVMKSDNLYYNTVSITGDKPTFEILQKFMDLLIADNSNYKVCSEINNLLYKPVSYTITPTSLDKKRALYTIAVLSKEVV